MKYKSVILITLLFTTFSLFAQVNINTVALSVGSIRAYSDPIYSKYEYSIYPELQIGGKLFMPFICWSVYWGYWTDGIKDPLPVMDMITYSISSHIFGARLTFIPSLAADHWPLPVSIYAGFAHHLLLYNYVGGFGYAGNKGQDHNQGSNTIEFGLQAYYPIGWCLQLYGEIQQFFPFPSDELSGYQRNRRVYKLGLAYLIGNY